MRFYRFFYFPAVEITFNYQWSFGLFQISFTIPIITPLLKSTDFPHFLWFVFVYKVYVCLPTCLLPRGWNYFQLPDIFRVFSNIFLGCPIITPLLKASDFAILYKIYNVSTSQIGRKHMLFYNFLISFWMELSIIMEIGIIEEA